MNNREGWRERLRDTRDDDDIYIYIYIRGSLNKFPGFFRMVTLIVHTWNSCPLRSNLLRLHCTCCTVPTTSRRPHGSPLVLLCHRPFGQSILVFERPYSSHTSHHPSQTPCLLWISYATQKLMLDSCKRVEKQSEVFHTFLWHFFQV